MEHRFADVNGIRLHYVTEGTGKLILFLHGFPEFWYEWKHQLTEFSQDYQAVAVDMRGYNLSSRPAAINRYEMPQLIEDIRELAAHLGASKFVLVGHDWGGVVAWSFAIAHPDLLDKLIIVNAPHPEIFNRELQENPAQQKASEYILMFRGPQAETILSANHYAALVGTVLTEGLKAGYFTEEDKQAYLQAWSQPGALTGGLNYYRASKLSPPVPGDPLPANNAAPHPFSVPTLVIWGEKDTALLTGNLNGLDRFVPNLQIKRVPEGTHWVIHEQPELVNRYLREFLQQS